MSQQGSLAIHLLLGVICAQLGIAHAQKDCGNCIELSPGTIAGVILGDLLLTVLIAVAVYYMTKCIHQQHPGANVTKPQHESPYEELQGQRMDIYSDLKNPASGSHFK